MDKTWVHGGNVYEMAQRLGCAPEEILDYSASINPLGPPPGLLEEFQRSFSLLQHYPDIHNQRLLLALARFHGVDPKWIAVGNGSTELIYRLPEVLRIRKALIAVPTFAEYRKAFAHHGVKLARCLAGLETQFQPRVQDLQRCYEVNRPEAVLLTHPGSPSGALLADEVRDWVLSTTAKDGVYCIVDEVFVDFCEDSSFKSFLHDHPGLILIRSMTKFYGIPGLRLGYLLTSPPIAQRISSALPPWSVNTLAQIAGVFCLAQQEYRSKTLQIVGEQRSRLYRELNVVDGFRALSSNANYLLIRLDGAQAGAACLQRDLLRTERILIRTCSSFEGLDDSYFRIAVRLPEQNSRLLRALRQWPR